MPLGYHTLTTLILEKMYHSVSKIVIIIHTVPCYFLFFIVFLFTMSFHVISLECFFTHFVMLNRTPSVNLYCLFVHFGCPYLCG